MDSRFAISSRAAAALLFSITAWQLWSAVPAAQAQVMQVKIRSIDARTLPRVRMRVSLTRDGVIPPTIARTAFIVTENGKTVPVNASCPDSATSNSVALVIDNSGSMSGLVFDSVRTGCLAVIDSLRPNDAAAIYTFTNGGTRLQDYTTDKPTLRAVVNGMSTNANTPLYNTIALALDDLNKRKGKRDCIVFTDGIDNASSISWQDLVRKTQSGGVRIFTIGFGTTQLNDDVLDELARSTGGFYTRTFAPSQLPAIFRNIVEEIVSPYCTIVYEAPSCEDSIRFVHVESVLDGIHAWADTVYAGPHRDDMLTARVVAPKRVMPGGTAVVYVAVSRPLDTGLQLSFRFLMRYDPGLLSISPVQPITVGTITQNTGASLRKLREGVLEFRADFVTPGLPAGNLIGVAFRARTADSSRPVAITIDSMTLAAGCPNTVVTIPAIIDVCQCEASSARVIVSDIVADAGADARLALSIDGMPLSAGQVLRAEVSYDPAALHLAGIEGDGSADVSGPEGSLRLLWMSMSDAGAGGNPLLHFHALPGVKAARVTIRLERVVLYADCCYDVPDDSAAVAVDGFCERLVRRVPVVTPFPNPASEVLHVRIVSPDADARLLTIVSADGKSVLALPFDAGGSAQTIVSIPVGHLQPGRYFVELTGGKRRVSAAVTILR